MDERLKYLQWDFVDNTIHEMIVSLNPSSIELQWNNKPISEIREILIHYFVEELNLCIEDDFYP